MPKADVLIVTVTRVESRAVMKAFQEITSHASKPEQIEGRTYHNLGKINGTHVYMAVSEMGAGGLGASLQTIERAIRTFQPSAVIMIGIAFGINNQKQVIGEVLVSQQILLYELQRVGQNKLMSRGDKAHASTRLVNLLRSADLYWSEGAVNFGLILTGEKLIDNIDYRDQLSQLAPEAIGGEMEGAGLYVACQDARVDWILVKAICDWADGNKASDKEARQQIAAENAARFVAFALQHVSFTEELSNKKALLIEYKAQFEAFLRRLEVNWSSERDSEPISVKDGKLILRTAASQVAEFRAQISNAEGASIIQILDDSLKRLKALQNHQVYIDGGVSFNAFWTEGNSIVQQLGQVLTELDKALE
jgi:nucleoside phosphorylase